MKKIFFFASFFALIFFLFFLYFLLSPIKELETFFENSVTIYDRNGIILYETLSSRDERKLYLNKDEIPPFLELAVIAAEDKRFYNHSGIDPYALVRAIFKNIKSFSLKQGGSTITQQTAKFLSKRRGRNILIKIYEFFLAIKLEVRLSKKEILSLYLNKLPFGKNIVGVKKASIVYFKTPLENLTIAQNAFLVAIPRSPSFYLKNIEKVENRKNEILKRMRDLNFITNDQYINAIDEKVTIDKNIEPFYAPHFVERIIKEHKNSKSDAIVTTLDKELNEKVAQIIKSKENLLKKIGAKDVAVIVIKNDNCEVVAYVGSLNYFSDESGSKIDGVKTARQPGSALKPFLYALAFENGLEPNSLLPDIPSFFKTAKDGAIYSPRNYDNVFRGPLSVRLALANSVNVPAVYLLDRVGIENFLLLLKRGGITTLNQNSKYYGLGLALGNGEVRLDELATLYSALARGGIYKKLIKSFEEKTFYEERLFSYDAAFLVTDILSDDKARQIAFGRRNYLEFPYKVASKTGTSEGYHDNFAFGYTKDITVGVWVGNFDRKPLKYSSGVSGAGPIYHLVMEEALNHILGRLPYPFEEILSPSDKLKKVEVCALSQKVATPNCPSKVFEWSFKEKKLESCDWHFMADKKILTIYPQQYWDWAKERGLLKDEIINNSVVKGEFQISSPLNGTVFLIDPSIPPKYQGIYLKCVNGSGRIRWFVNGKEYKIAQHLEKVFLPLTIGEHTIVAFDENGRKAESKIVVR